MTVDRAAARAASLAAFLKAAGWADARLDWRAGDASFRRYARLTAPLGQGAKTAMLMDAPPAKEAVGPFLGVAAILRTAGLSVPAVLAADRAAGFLLLEDFGDATFTALLEAGRPAEPLYALATDALIAIRRDVGAPGGLPAYDPGARVRHLATFLDWLWPEALPPGPTPAQRALFNALWLDALKRAPTLGRGFVHRDFHVDNLMRLEGRAGVAACGLLDFQDAAHGPFAYDLASLVEDARRDIAPEVKAACIERYRAAFPAHSAAEIAAALAVHGGQRHARVAGLWVRLWRRDGKPRYLMHMQRTWALLEASLAHPLLGDVRAFLDAAFPADARKCAIALAAEAAPGRVREPIE